MATSDIVTLLGAVPALQTAFLAKPGGFDVPVSSDAELYSLLNPLADVYAITAGDQPVFPHIVHQMVGVNNLDVDGFRLMQVDNYLLSIRHRDYDALRTLSNGIITTLRGSQYSIQPVDLGYDYEDNRSRDHAADRTDNHFRADMALEFGYPVLPTGGPAQLTDLPVAFVWLRSRDAADPEDTLDATQRMNNDYSIVLVTSGGDLPSLRDDVMAALLGKQLTDTFGDLKYVSGRHVAAVGDMEIWQETYSDWQQITET